MLRYLCFLSTIFASHVDAEAAPLKWEVSTSNPVMLPGAPSLIIHLEGSVKERALVGKDVSPIVGRVVSSGLPTTEECAFRTELPLQTWRRLRQPVIKDRKMRRDGRHYLDEEEVVCFCEKVVRDGCYLAAEGDAG